MTTLNKPTPHPHAELLKEWLEDTSREIQVKCRTTDYWIKSSFHERPCWNLGALDVTLKYRLKPKTLRIGSFDVPEPERKPLERGTTYWTIGTRGEGVNLLWSNDDIDFRFLSRGRVWLKEEDAGTASKALTELLGGTW